MTLHAKLTSKYQITIPKAVRQALGLEEGDDVAFELTTDQAVLRRGGTTSAEEFLARIDAIDAPRKPQAFTSDDEAIAALMREEDDRIRDYG